MAPIWLVLALQISAPPEASPSIIRATMHGKCIYTTGVVGKEPDTKWTFGGGALWIQKADLNEKAGITSLDYMFTISGRRDALLRWQLIKGQFYCVAYALAGGDTASAYRFGHMQSVSLAAIESVNANRQDERAYTVLYQKYRKSIDYGPHLSPVGKATVFKTEGVQARVFFDFWCPGDKQLEVYVNLNDLWQDEGGPWNPPSKPLPKGNRLIREVFHPERKCRPDQDPIIQWDTVGEWTFDWEGPFYVATNGDDRFIVTDTGRVFVAPRGAKPWTPLKEIWKGKPVDALIHDDDLSKWYAFTKDQYFEIADPIKAVAHTIPIRRSKTADEALETAAKCGRVIRGIPEPKEKKEK